MSRADHYINLLKSKILSDENIIEICKEFKLETPNFNNSHDWIFGIMSREILGKREEQKLKVYLNKFPINNGLDCKKLKRQINLLGRTPEQQRNDMFKTMDEASKKNEGEIELFKGITFEELQNNIIKKGGVEADRILRMREQHKERMEELCDLCGKFHKEHDSKGFIYFVSDDNLKAGWSCVEEIVRKNKIER